MNPMIFRSLLSVGFASVLLLGLIRLIYLRKLRETYAIAWILFSILLLLSAFFPWMIMVVAEWLGIYYLTLLLGIFLIFVLITILYLSTVLSAHSDAVCCLTQRCALMEQEIDELKKRQLHEHSLNERSSKTSPQESANESS
jgi:hypothetical protein